MKTAIAPEIKEVMTSLHYRPAVSIIMPFEPKMSLKTELSHSLKIAADKVERELLEAYPYELCTLVMQKLRSIISHLNFNTRKNSIAIYVSPVFEKVLYLDIAVEERIVVDESFEIRDLVFSKKQLHKYLVLLLSGSESRIYLGNTESFERILSNFSDSLVDDAHEKISNFGDMSSRKELLMNKFLRQTDNTLEIILNIHNLPLFVVGTEKMIGHFRKITKHGSAIIDYLHGNYEEASIPELRKILAPHIDNWKLVKQTEILKQLEEADGNGKIATGIREVWQEAVRQKGQLLVVEKDYMYAAQHGSKDDIIYKAVEPFKNFSYIKDAVDDVIEKVLLAGGDVEFVEKGVLSQYNHIALVLYY